MNEYNDRWTREKFLEYRRLKRSGFTQSMLIEHFGEDIYHSGIYNKKSTILPWLEFITEITVTPEYTNYNVKKEISDIYSNKFDYIIDFEDKGVKYIISLFYYIIDELETLNIVLTTEKQWIDYKKRIFEIKDKGYLTQEDRDELIDIVEKETGFNQLYSVMKRSSYVLLDFIGNKLSNLISLGDTKNPVKINLYRNIIKGSFPNVSEIMNKFDEVGNRYYIYKIDGEIIEKD